MKHVVFVIGHYKNGGVPMRATNLANELGRRGYRVTILVTKEIGKEIFFELQENVKLISLAKFVEETRDNQKILDDRIKREKQLHNCKRMRYLSRYFPKWDRELAHRVRSIRIGELLRVYMLLNPDALYIPFGLAYYEETFCAAEKLSCKIIYAERNAPELEMPKDRDKASRLLKMLGQANGAVFQTRDEQRFYEKVINNNVVVIHNPIKNNLPKPYIGERRKVIVNFCRVAPQKNLKLLIDSFAKLHKDHEDYLLEIYGNTVEDSEELLCDELKKYVLTLNLDRYVKILPPVADVHNKVRDCVMFVSSSDFEGLSNSMIEAMAIGLPCVCTNCLGGGAREVIENEKSGLIVPINDVDALYNGMKRMIEDVELARRCGENATRIRGEQSVEKIVDQWIEVIESA